MIQNPINIVIVSLNEKFSKNVAVTLANNLDMFVIDCHELIVYDLINPKEVVEKCGLEYLKKRERSVMKNCANYYNTAISINFDLLKENIEQFKNSLIFYLRLPEDKVSKVANSLDYENRDKTLLELSNVQIELSKCLTLQAVKKIISRIGEIYENC